MRSFLILAVLAVLNGASAALNAKAWKSNSEFPTEKDYPEHEYLKSKPNTAIAFSGGGSRAYTGAMGCLAAFHELDLLKNIRYIGGISGGAWATTTFTYVQNVSNDDVFLGKVADPKHITVENLKKMEPGCARGLSAPEMTLIALEAIKDKKVDSPAAAWSYAVSKTYLEPVGIKPNTRFSWDAATVKDIKSRNSALANAEFTVPVNKDRPFPVIGTTLVGPVAGAPFTAKTQNYSLLEITPLYVGTMKNLDIKYKYKSIGLTHSRRVGGAIEPFAFARKGGGAPAHGLAKKVTSGVLSVPEPETFLDLQFSAGTSSYAPGSFFESIGIPKVAAELSMEFQYWSPDDEVKPDFTPMMFTDGGCYQDISLIQFMQRRVSKIVLFFLSSTPLKPFEDWDVNADPLKEGQVTDDLSAFFGALPDTEQRRWENRSFELEKNQVFATSDYTKVITALQTAQQAGKGIIATMNLTTVKNDWWGIPAGETFEITFSYLGRLPKWEAQLNKEVYKLAVPAENAQDLSVDVSSGPFKNFPHFITKGGGIDNSKANLLADLTGWAVLQHEQEFRRILS